jgi:hypothetical protein
VGTPARLLKINDEMGDDKLLSPIKLVILDASYVDLKKQTLLSLNTTRGDCYEIIGKLSGRNDDGVKIVLV